MAVLASFVWVLVVGVGYRVFKVIRFNNVIILGMVFFLTLELFSKIVLFSVNAYIYNNTDEFTFHPAVYTIIPMCPVVFLTLGALCNLYNWIFYFFKIGQMAAHIDSRASLYLSIDYQNKQRMLLNLVFGGLGLTVLLFFVGITIYSLNNSTNEVELVQEIAGVNFIILGTAFGVSGCLNNNRLQKFFPLFYSENKKMLWFATCGLCIPIIGRGCLDVFRSCSDGFVDMVNENLALYDSMIFIIFDCVPIGFQFSSLVFGYIRKKRNNRQGLEIRGHGSNGTLSS
jgi:hypothetical protein